MIWVKSDETCCGRRSEAESREPMNSGPRIDAKEAPLERAGACARTAPTGPAFGRPDDRHRADPGDTSAMIQIGYSAFNKFSAPETSTLPGASSMFSDFTTPSSTTMQ